jgi:hypothetical protein
MLHLLMCDHVEVGGQLYRELREGNLLPDRFGMFESKVSGT